MDLLQPEDCMFSIHKLYVNLGSSTEEIRPTNYKCGKEQSSTTQSRLVCCAVHILNILLHLQYTLRITCIASVVTLSQEQASMEELQVQFFTILVGFLFIILSYLLHRCLQLDRVMVERRRKKGLSPCRSFGQAGRLLSLPLRKAGSARRRWTSRQGILTFCWLPCWRRSWTR